MHGGCAAQTSKSAFDFWRSAHDSPIRFETWKQQDAAWSNCFENLAPPVDAQVRRSWESAGWLKIVRVIFELRVNTSILTITSSV